MFNYKLKPKETDVHYVELTEYDDGDIYFDIEGYLVCKLRSDGTLILWDDFDKEAYSPPFLVDEETGSIKVEYKNQ